MTDPEQVRTTPEGHTREEPRPSELGKAGTPGAGKTPGVPHDADAEEREDAHAVESEHGHVEPAVGPVDWLAWGYALIGVVVGLLVLVLFYVAVA